MTTAEQLHANFDQRLIMPAAAGDIPRGVWLVYILTYNDKPIVVGHGKVNRAKVIFDDSSQITSGHIKALFVRIYRLFGTGVFQQFLIACETKEEAKRIENNLHKSIGGNDRELPENIKKTLYARFTPNSLPYMVLRMALCSSFDGLSDLKLWRRKGILDDAIWSQLSTQLALDDF